MCQKRTKRRTKAAQTGQKKGAPNEGGRLCGNSADSREWPTKRTGNRKGQCEREIKAKTIAIQRRNVFAECCTLPRPQAAACCMPQSYTHILPLSLCLPPTLCTSLPCSCWTCAFNLQDTCLPWIEGSSSRGTLSYRVHIGTAYTAQRVQRPQVTH